MLRLADQNRDGTNDSLRVEQNGVLLLQIQGKQIGNEIGLIEIYDDQGDMRIGLMDLNADGSIDYWTQRELDGTMTIYKDQNFDGSVDDVVRGLRQTTSH